MEYLILVISLAGIVFGADYLVAGAVSIARKFKVSDFVIGAAIVGVGTSMPELVVSFIGAIQGNADVAIGNVVGSNIFNILGILGITAIFFPIAVNKDNMKFEMPLCIGVSILLTILVFNFFNGNVPTISRVDGLVLLLCFALFMWYSFYRDRKQNTSGPEQTVTQEEKTPLWLAVVKVLGGLAVLITSCDFFVDNAVLIAKSFGVNDAFISLTLIACGTSLPELAASVAAALKKNTQLALGNIIGSNIFNITLILGLSSQVMPLNSSGITAVDYAVMIGAAIATVILGWKGKIGRLSGTLLFISFIAYTWYLLSSQIA
ncbi:MAG: calcium/sodium antiporter [Bacteroidales bacterium]|nr:calcium/sodium antiporter [Bacteroidales bacterium]MBO5074257.1 calcium/sodium antiporter [Bacteroidales bacterium]MBR1959709.1 calcium/sodium antiporter [Bacteroidales bacterium]